VVYVLGYADSGSVAVGCWLEALNTTVDGLAKGALVVILLCCLEEKDCLGKVGDFVVWRKATGLGKCNVMITGFEINKPTSGSIVELLVCRVWVIGFVFISHLRT